MTGLLGRSIARVIFGAAALWGAYLALGGNVGGPIPTAPRIVNSLGFPLRD